MTSPGTVACWLMGTSQDRPGAQRAITAAGYVLLFVLGAVQALVGSFQYSQPPTPLIAIVLIVILLATCVGCSWGMGTFAGALVPAMGWIIVSFIIAMPRPNGSVVVTATPAGEWYLYGGAVACLIGAVTSVFLRLRRPAPPR
jgi:peptidoglycan/LPS O-acetylase OafA/YrhL